MVSRRLEKPVSLRYNACPMAIPAKDFVSLLQDVGFDFFTGVPDSTLGGIIATLIERRVYIPAVREDEAVGLAAGAYMGGKIPAVLMQNSGLGKALKAVISLNLIYLQPCLLLVSWRGHDGTDAPEHLVVGQGMKIGRGSCRGRGEILGGAGSFKKKKRKAGIRLHRKIKHQADEVDDVCRELSAPTRRAIVFLGAVAACSP